jgi:hypothetical protein
MTKLQEININGIVYLAVKVNGIIRIIKPLALIGQCRRPGSNGYIPTLH